MNALTRTNPTFFSGSRDPFFSFVDRMFRDSWSDDSDYVSDSNGGTRTWLPAVDIFESDEAFVATADLPGVKKDDLDISIEDSVLTVSGERRFDNDEANGNFRRIERAYGTFRRSFTLPRGVDSTKVEANFQDGVLTLTMPKSETAKSRKIKVK